MSSAPSSRYYSFWTADDKQKRVLVSDRTRSVVRVDHFQPPYPSTFFSCSDDIDYVSTIQHESQPHFSFSCPPGEHVTDPPSEVKATVQIPVSRLAGGIQSVALSVSIDNTIIVPRESPLRLELVYLPHQTSADEPISVAHVVAPLTPGDYDGGDLLRTPMEVVLKCTDSDLARAAVASSAMSAIVSFKLPPQPDLAKLEDAVLLGRLSISWTD